MIPNAYDAARALVPGLQTTSLSIALVCTTRPKYLVFSDAQVHPVAVVQFGPGDDLMRTHRILTLLGKRLAGIIPQSFACVPWRDGLYVNVQSGLEGMPWFVMRERYESRQQWEALLARASVLLASLHAAAAAIPEFRGRIHPAQGLAQQMAECRRRGTLLPDHVQGALADDVTALEELGTIDAVAQHGDYGLNNLLISADTGELRLLDFDEFGMTFMPLQDEVGLATSFYLTQGEPCGIDLQTALELCTADSSRRFGAPVRAALIRYHWLWRFNLTHGESRRADVAARLLQLLERRSVA